MRNVEAAAVVYGRGASGDGEATALAGVIGVAPTVRPRGGRRRHEPFAGDVAPASLDNPTAN